jgi:hypothetical protein
MARLVRCHHCHVTLDVGHLNLPPSEWRKWWCSPACYIADGNPPPPGATTERDKKDDNTRPLG